MDPVTGGAVSGFILTIVQTVKAMIPKAWYDWFLPLSALALGVAYTTFISPDETMSTGEAIVEGLRSGAAAIGVFSIGKAGVKTAGAVKKKVK